MLAQEETKMRSIESLFNDKNEWGSFHDVVAEIKYRDYTVSELRKIFDRLPLHIKDQAQVHGISDSVVRDDAYVFLRDRPELIENAPTDTKEVA
jgi:hypothetical protein